MRVEKESMREVAMGGGAIGPLAAGQLIVRRGGGQTAGTLSIILTAPLGAMLIAGTAPRWLEVERGKNVGGEDGVGGGSSGAVVPGKDAGGEGVGVSEARGWGRPGGAAKVEIDADNLDQLVSLMELEIEEGVQDIGRLCAVRVCVCVLCFCVPFREGRARGCGCGMWQCGGI